MWKGHVLSWSPGLHAPTGLRVAAQGPNPWSPRRTASSALVRERLEKASRVPHTQSAVNLIVSCEERVKMEEGEGVKNTQLLVNRSDSGEEEMRWEGEEEGGRQMKPSRRRRIISADWVWDTVDDAEL